MSKSGSRYGRRSNWFKIHCLLQEQQQQHQHQHQQLQQQHQQLQNKSTSSSTSTTSTTTTMTTSTTTTTADSMSGGSAACSSADSTNGANGGTSGRNTINGVTTRNDTGISSGLPTVPALALVQHQYQQNYMKSTQCNTDSGRHSDQSSRSTLLGSNGLVALHRASVPMFNDTHPNQRTHTPTHTHHKLPNNNNQTSANHQDHRGLHQHHNHHHHHHYEHLQQHSPASDSGASSACDADESSSHGRGDDNGSMENFSVSVELKQRYSASAMLEKIDGGDPSSVPPQLSPTQLSRTASSSSNHLYEEFRARYGVFLNEYRNASRHQYHHHHHPQDHHHLDINHRHLIATASALHTVSDDDQTTAIIQLQNEPIDLSLGTRKRKLSGTITASPAAESPALSPASRAVAPFELQRPAPLDLTLLRSDGLTG